LIVSFLILAAYPVDSKANSPSFPENKIYNFNIPAQDIQSALDEFIKKTKLSVIYDTTGIGAVKTHSLKGRYSPIQALKILLEETGLIFEVIGTQSLAIKKETQYADRSQAADSREHGRGDPDFEISAPADMRNGSLPNVKYATKPFTLKEMVVTALKRPENLQKIAVAASVLTDTALTHMNASDISALNNMVPSVQIRGTISGREPMGVRGISSVSNEAAVGISSGVAIEIDGVPVPSDSFAGNLVEDVQNIEVLKGPQATLGGRTASAGVINYVTRKPTTYFTGDGSVTWTSDNEKRFNGHVSGPLSEKIISSLSGFYNYTPYPIENIQLGHTTTQESYGGRAKIQFKPTEKFSAMLTLHYAKAKADGFNFVYTYLTPGLATTFPPFFTQDQALTGIKVDMENQNFSSPVTDAGALHEDKNIRLDLNYDLGALSLSSTTAYQYEDQHVVQDLFALNQYIYPAYYEFFQNVVGWPQSMRDAIPHFENKQDIWQDVSQISQELKVVSPTDQRVSFVAGLFFSSTTVDMKEYRPFVDTSTSGAYVDIHVKPTTQTYDIYGRATTKLTDKTNLVTGLRFNYDYLKYTYDQIFQSGWGPFYSKSDDGSTAVVGDIGLQHTLEQGTMIYGTYSRGYAPKVYNTATVLQSNAPLEPVGQEHIYNFEVGSKGTYFNHTLQVNASAFYTNYKDYQIQTFVTLPGSTFPALNLQNAGEASTKGVELDTTWVPTSNFKAGLSAAYIDAKWEKFTDAQCYGVATYPETLPPNYRVNADGEYVQDISGKTMPNSPKFKFVLSAEQRFAVPNSVYDLAVGGTYSYRTKAYMTPDVNPHAVQDAFGILNLYVTLDRLGGKYLLTAFCNNVFDKNYYTTIEDFWTGPWNANAVIGQPARDASRYFGLRFAAKF